MDGSRASARSRRGGPLASGARVAAVSVVLVSLVAGASAWLAALLDLDALYPWKVALALSAGAVAVWTWLGRETRLRRFGAANQVTLVRATLCVLVLATVGEAAGDRLAALVCAAALVVAALDGVDGWIARRFGDASAFGARFDMETDALLILALSLLAWQWDKAGAWVLLAGGARYVFVLAGALAPWMRAPLAPSLRRKAVCVLQVTTLIVCVSPWLVAPASAWIAACGVLALLLSFAVDTVWLARRARASRSQGVLS